MQPLLRLHAASTSVRVRDLSVDMDLAVSLASMVNQPGPLALIEWDSGSGHEGICGGSDISGTIGAVEDMRIQ